MFGKICYHFGNGGRYETSIRELANLTAREDSRVRTNTWLNGAERCRA